MKQDVNGLAALKRAIILSLRATGDVAGASLLITMAVDAYDRLYDGDLAGADANLTSMAHQLAMSVAKAIVSTKGDAGEDVAVMRSVLASAEKMGTSAAAVIMVCDAFSAI